MKKVLIVTDLSFPKGSAMASRIVSFCHMLNDLNYKAHVITGKTENDEPVIDDSYSYSFVKSNRSYGLQSYLGNENLAKAVDDYLKENEVEFVLTTSLNMNFKKIFDVVKKHNKKLVLEQCEWYDSSSFRFGKLDIRYINFLINIKHRYLKVDGTISISRLLDQYYKEKGINSIRIPSILDVKNTEYDIRKIDNTIKLIYTGNASNSKELLEPILIALNDDKYKNHFTFDIYGLNNKQLLKNINNKKSLLNKNIKAHGFVKQELIKNIIREADYQILIRPYRKSSNAGFPTKLCESMSVGTPVISNDTGDICLYLNDGINGFVTKGIDSFDVKETFDKILSLKDYSQMRKEARSTAEKSFDYRNYSRVFNELVENIWVK